MKTIDIKFFELCDEIDQWKEEVKFWKDKYEKLEKDYKNHLDNSLKSAQKDVANILTFALHATDDKNGNLVISKNSREIIKKQLNS